MSNMSDLYSGGRGLYWTKITANTNAKEGNGYLFSASGNLTLTLPGSPTEGNKIGVVDADGMATTHTLTIARNGNNIQGSANDLVIDKDNAGFTLVYSDASQGWVIVTEISSASPLTWVKSTASETAINRKGYMVVPTANHTLTLPSSPSEGDIVGFVDANGMATTHTLTIARNGQKIQGSASDLVVDTNNSGFTLSYVDATIGWVIVTELNATSELSSSSFDQMQVWAFE